MNMLGRMNLGLPVMLAILAGGGGALLAQSPPAAGAPAGVPAGAPAAGAPAKPPTVDDLLAAQKPAPFDFSDARITDIIDYIARSYGVEIVNKYNLTDRLTMKLGALTAREAIGILNASILDLGYAVVESVRGDPPHVVLTIVPTKLDAGTLVPVFQGNDPAKIPEGDARRTQVLTFTAVDPDMVRDMIVSVVGKQAEITVNPATKTLIITDTSTHVHTAAALLQVLEKQAADKK